MDGIELLLPHQISLCAGLSWKYLAVRNEKRRHLSKIQDTRNIVHRTMMPQCPSKWALGTSHSSPSRFWNPHRSASGSHTVSHQSLLTAARTCSTFSGVLLVAGLPERGSLSTDSRPTLKHLCHTFYLCSTQCIIPKSLLHHPNSFCGGLFELNVKYDADSFIDLLAQWFWVQRPHNTHAHWMTFTGPTD